MTKIDLIDINSDSPKHITDGVVVEGLFVQIPMKEVSLASGVNNNTPSIIEVANSVGNNNVGGNDLQFANYELILTPNIEMLDGVNNSAVTLRGDLINSVTNDSEIGDVYEWFLDGEKLEKVGSNITISIDQINTTKLASKVKLVVTFNGKEYTDSSTIHIDESDEDKIPTREDPDDGRITPPTSEDDGNNNGNDNDNGGGQPDSGEDVDEVIGTDPNRQLDIPDRV